MLVQAKLSRREKTMHATQTSAAVGWLGAAAAALAV